MRASSAGGRERLFSQHVASMASMCGAFVGVDPAEVRLERHIDEHDVRSHGPNEKGRSFIHPECS
jgi:hypothetical protein